MPWCPLCRSEYRSGIAACTECGLPLVAKREDLENASGIHTMSPSASLCLLAVTPDEASLERAKTLLNDSEIPFIVTNRNPEAYKDAAPSYPTSDRYILVDRRKLDCAREIIGFYLPQCAMPEPPDGPNAGEDAEQEPEGEYTGRYVRRGQWMLILVFSAFAAALLLTGIYLLRA